MVSATSTTGDGTESPTLSRANVCISVKDAADATCSTADIVLTEPGLATTAHTTRGLCQIFRCMRNYDIYACVVTIRIVL